MVLAFLIFNSCNKNNSSKIEGINKLNADFLAKDSSTHRFNIYGKWDIFVNIRNGVRSNCNTCPKILFSRDIAKLIYPSGETETYNYNTNSDTILFTNSMKNNKSNNNFYFDNKYLMILKKEKNYIELELKQLENNCSFILRQ